MNPIVSGKISTAITKMTKADALAPIVALEGTVVAGRTYQAYKRASGMKQENALLKKQWALSYGLAA